MNEKEAGDGPFFKKRMVLKVWGGWIAKRSNLQQLILRATLINYCFQHMENV